ncbi:MAG: polysaccharide deacetylase [Paenibacillus sp.]|jgi:peptidoglycan/xylan/chitin deacetylase (PgdA/CDA1 family)|nr:polysaccharide deacetylase [Paenibacillus sp.]
MNRLIFKAVALTLIGLSIIIPSLNAAKTTTIYKDQVAVIMYHHVDDEAKSSGTVTTRLFKDQLTHLKNKGYQFITLKQFKQFMQGSSVPNNAVLVTFDDGYQSFYTNAYPILKSMRIPAVNFVITADMENPLASYIPSMSRDHIIEMTQDTDFIDLQCHTNNMHGKLPDDKAILVGRVITNGVKETEDEYKQRIVSDTQACVTKLSGLYAGPIDSYAYPFGIYDRQSSQYIEEGGMRFAFTIVPEMATRDLDPLQIPRINAGNSAISPEGLEHSIKRRVVATKHPYEEIELIDAVSQLGGKASLDKSGQVQIQYLNTRWTGAVNSQKLTSLTGSQAIHLQKPLYLKNNKVYIGLKDLENAVGVQIVYNPNVQGFSVRQTPAVKK